MRILYIGDASQGTTSVHRADALRRLGHDVVHLDARDPLPRGRLVGGVGTRLGLWPFVPVINASLRRRIAGRAFDLAWVDAGSEISAGFVRWLKYRGMRVVSYVCDDPLGGRDGPKWNLYRRALREYDLAVVMRSMNIEESLRAGARRVARVLMSYDPIAHAPRHLTAPEQADWGSEVAFIGSWMPERGPFMARLLELGVPLTIRGHHWQKAPEYARIRGALRGPGIYGPDYVRALQGAKISLGLLSRGNRDLHTQRSAEVPFIGRAAFCAEHTSEHEAMFRHGVEAMLWRDADECAAQCKALLADEPARLRMVAAARARIVQLGLSNDATLEWILSGLDRNEPVLERSLPAFPT